MLTQLDVHQLFNLIGDVMGSVVVAVGPDDARGMLTEGVQIATKCLSHPLPTPAPHMHNSPAAKVSRWRRSMPLRGDHAPLIKAGQLKHSRPAVRY